MRSFAFFVLLVVLLCAVFHVDGQRKKGPRSRHCGKGPEDEKCQSLIDNKQVCACPKEEGRPGFIRDPRWFFDKKSGQCQMFSWSTDGGNCNNFETEEECEDACL
uniref:Putative bpti/kunitz family of serine protease inhibitor n=1 Tax=Amblyomma americanum TaxID=6943 RepID=A0A0C9SEP3_AMBAM